MKEAEGLFVTESVFELEDEKVPKVSVSEGLFENVPEGEGVSERDQV